MFQSLSYSVKDDPNADPLSMVLPLQGDITRTIAADLNASGHGKCCACCGKPFTAARKQRAVGRMTHVDHVGLLVSTAWLFCGRCAAGIRRNGGRMSAHLMHEARSAASAALVLATPAKGNA